MNTTLFIPLAAAFAISAILCPVCIPLLRRLKFGQNIREEGPEAHLKKAGTPTMGGVVILAAMLAGTAMLSMMYPDALYVMLFTALFGAIGLVDDLLKIVHHQSEGLKAWQKMGLQIVVTVLLVLYVGLLSPCGTMTLVPFYGEVDLGGWFYPLAIVAVLGTVNGANFTDGLDGLASSVTIMISILLTVASEVLAADVAPASMAMIGAVAGFLIYNAYPAKIFMGDTGSLGLGGFVAVSALMMKMPVFIIIFAFIYLAEVVSVILQVGFFKLTHGKRLFKMAPVHHHFELCGWSEVRVVVVFTIVTVVLCLVAFAGLEPMM